MIPRRKARVIRAPSKKLKGVSACGLNYEITKTQKFKRLTADNCSKQTCPLYSIHVPVIPSDCGVFSVLHRIGSDNSQRPFRKGEGT